MGHTTTNTDTADAAIVDGVLITRKDGDLFRNFLVSMFRLELMFKGDARNDVTYGELLARIWKAIECQETTS